MKFIGKKVMAGAIVASFVLGGGFVGALKAAEVFAESGSQTTADTAASGKTKADRGMRFEGHAPGPGFGFGKGGRPLADAATAIGIDEKALMDELKQGKTIAQVAQEKAGLTEEALLQKLTDAETKKLSDAVAAGKLTQEQADKMKASIADRLKKSVEQTFPKPGERPQGKEGDNKQGDRGKGFGGPMDGKRMPGGPQGGMWGGDKEIAALIGVTEQELRDARKAGKSLAEIAQEKGISEDQLIAKLKDSMTDKLKQFVESKGGPGPRGDAPKQTKDGKQPAASAAPATPAN